MLEADGRELRTEFVPVATPLLGFVDLDQPHDRVGIDTVERAYCSLQL